MKAVLVKLSDEAHKKLKVKAALQDMHLKDLLTEKLEEFADQKT